MKSTGNTEETEHEVKDRRLCSDCVGEAFLSEMIAKNGENAPCFYCGKKGRTYSIDELADEIETAFEHHYQRTPTEPSSYEYAMHSEHGWYRSGDPVVDVIADAANIDGAAAEDIHGVLEERHADFESHKMGEECPFDSDSQYERKDPDDRGFVEQWRSFEQSLKTEARFFSRNAEATLAEVFEGLHTHKTVDGRDVIVEAGPGKSIGSIFRARVFQADQKLQAALMRPDLEVGSPPAKDAAAGRMNARGVSVFYGATSAELAVAEVRPPVGSRVVVGRFDIIRPVRLLDLEALRSVSVDGSIFDSGYKRRLERATFLERFSRLLTMPVMPDDEPFDYLVTQAVSDYLATIMEPALDGIIYPSVQAGIVAVNIVLFHKAALIERLSLPVGIEIDAHLYSTSEDGTEPDYSVFETVLEDKEKEAKPENGFPTLFWTASSLEEYDSRDATLRLDVGTVEVHHIQRVDYVTRNYSVLRHRYVKERSKM